MVDEGKVWDELVADDPRSKHRISFSSELVPEPEAKTEPSAPDTYAAEATLISLAEKSNLISESYERRNNPPTAQTYEESKEIIRALGVPCLDSDGPYEAEALAASLVLNGHADYVASEDTVCRSSFTY
jgi:flap endonuclease-1